MNIDKVLDRCKKLSRLADSQNEHEAAAAAAQLQKLMLQYEIDFAQVAEVDDTPKEAIEDASILESDCDPRRRATWRGSLATVLARSVGARCFYMGADIRVFGRASQIAKVRYMFAALSREIDRLADEKWDEVKSWTHEHGKRFKNGFRRGAVSAIAMRLEDRNKMIHDRILTAENESVSKALTVIQTGDAEVASEYKRFSKGFRTARSAPVTSYSGWEAGRKAGASMSINESAGSLGRKKDRIAAS